MHLKAKLQESFLRLINIARSKSGSHTNGRETLRNQNGFNLEKIELMIN